METGRTQQGSAKVMQPDLDYFQLLGEARTLQPSTTAKPLRVAVMADCAAQYFQPLLRVLFRRKGVEAELYEGAFDAIELEVRNPHSGFYSFSPDVVVMLRSVQKLRDSFYQSEEEQVFFEEQLRQLRTVWESIGTSSHALILQSTYVAPMERFFGNYDRKVETSFASMVSTLNSHIVDESRSQGNVLLLDVEAIASWVGRRNWFDERMWAIGKSLCSLEYLPLVAQNIVDVSLAAQGRGVKCVVLDLDNTLWGGIVGDDGPHGIKISAHGDGEDFYRLQCFFKKLKSRGILLAVCSKNEHSNAVKPFHDNGEMVLKLDDFVRFVASWNDKPQTIKTIQQELNIGLDSILFIDDNPFERAAVRTLLPDVVVPELPEDPSDWIRTLSELNLFETASYSAQDSQRSEAYLQEARRKAASEAATSFEEFLRSLDTTIEVRRFAPEHLPRIAQLFQRSNQFNLTTRRLNESECEAMMHDVSSWIPWQATLKDRFGDQGLISLVILQPGLQSGTVAITDWVMSCRVLGRGVEEHLMNRAVKEARAMGLHVINGTYVPTLKNGMVKDFYSRFGFAKTREEADGTSEWVLNVSDYRERPVLIRSVDEAMADQPNQYDLKGSHRQWKA